MRYDILFTASTHKSVQNAIRFANSIKHIEGNHLCIITGCIKEDIKEIAHQTNTITFIAETNSLYLGRAWGFVWAMNNGIEADYLCSCDDDLEFTENSSDMVAVLHRASEYGFSTLAFQNKVHGYRSGREEGEYLISPRWLNGDCMFSHIEDNLKYGLPDCFLDVPLMYYSEVEYQQRMQVMTGRPVIVPISGNKYIHHFRTDPILTALRAEMFADGHSAGLRVWKKKHGYTMDKLTLGSAKGAFEAIEKSRNVKHIMFGGQTNDWKAIYDSLKGGFRYG